MLFINYNSIFNNEYIAFLKINIPITKYLNLVFSIVFLSPDILFIFNMNLDLSITGLTVKDDTP